MSNARNLARLLPNASGQLPDAAMSSGSVLQVVSVTKTDTFSSTSTSFVDVTGLAATITPLSANSKIYVVCNFQRGCSAAAMSSFRLTRNGSPIGGGTPAGSKPSSISMTYAGSSDVDAHALPSCVSMQDSPATTSAVTYQLQALQQSGSTLWIGRTARDSDDGFMSRTSSTITLMEIAG